MFRPTRLKIDLAALKHNLSLLKQANGADFFCPMVKANAYGHGDVVIAQAIESVGTSALGVALVEEGLSLRTGGVKAPILVFAPFDKASASAMFTHQLTPVVTRFEDLDALAALKCKMPISVHLKFNTGMCRLGFDSSELTQLRARLHELTHIQVAGVCTHLTHGHEAHLPEGQSQRQLQTLKAMAGDFPGVRHAHKSASLGALANHSQSKTPGIGARPGISIYGLPYEGRFIGPGLKPVLSWVSALARVHEIKAGESVSYGARWTAARPSWIGVVPVGYGDGYRRSLTGAEVLFRGARVPVVGIVCMDYIHVDLTDVLRDGVPQAGEEIVLLGRQGTQEISAVELAEKAGTIAYEIVTSISSRVARQTVG